MGAKRASSAAASPSKRARGESINARVKRVVQALADAELPSEVPQAARVMLASGATNALASCVEDRHKMQASVCEHMKDVLDDIMSHLQAAAAKVKAGNAEITAELEALQSTAEAADAALSEADKAVTEQKAKLVESRQAVEAEEGNVKAAKAKREAVLKARAAEEKERARRVGIDESLQKLIAGNAGEPKEAKRECVRLAKILERVGAEPALVSAMPEVLTKVPEERKGFDEMVVESLGGFVKELLAAADAKLAEGEAEMKEAEIELVGSDAVKEKAIGELEAEQTRLTELESVLDEKRSSKDAADEQVEERKGACIDKLQEVEQAEAEVADFEEVLQTFAGLLERSSAPPPEAPKDAAEAAPEAAPEAPTE